METTQQLIDVIKTSVEQESVENLNSFLFSTNVGECFNSRTLSFLLILLEEDAADEIKYVQTSCARRCLQHFLYCDIDHSVWEKLADEVSMICLLSISVPAKKMEKRNTERSVQLVRDVLNTIEILADSMMKKMLPSLMKLASMAVHSNICSLVAKNFCQLPLLALIRDLLQKSSPKTCLEILPSVIYQLTKLSNGLLLCEDYETQVTVVEILALSWIFIKEDHPKALFSGFSGILPIFNSLKFINFKQDCRLFLDQFKRKHENEQSAFGTSWIMKGFKRDTKRIHLGHLPLVPKKSDADPIRIGVRSEDREREESFIQPEMIVVEPDLPLDYQVFHQPTTRKRKYSDSCTPIKGILVKEDDSRKTTVKSKKKVQFNQALDFYYIPSRKVAKITKDIVVKKPGSRKRLKKIMKKVQFKQASDSDSDYITSTTVTKTTEIPDKYNKSARDQSKKMCTQKDLQSEENRNEDIASVVPPKLDLDSCLPPDAYEVLGIDQLALEAMSQTYQESVASQGLFKISDVMDFGKSCISQIRNSVLGVTKLYNRERKMKIEAFDLQAQSSLAALQAQSQQLETVTNNLAEIGTLLEKTYKLQKEIVSNMNTEAAQLQAAQLQAATNMVDLQTSETTRLKSTFRGMGQYMKNLVCSFITNRATQH